MSNDCFNIPAPCGKMLYEGAFAACCLGNGGGAGWTRAHRNVSPRRLMMDRNSVEFGYENAPRLLLLNAITHRV